MLSIGLDRRVRVNIGGVEHIPHQIVGFLPIDRHVQHAGIIADYASSQRLIVRPTVSGLIECNPPPFFGARVGVVNDTLKALLVTTGGIGLVTPWLEGYQARFWPVPQIQ